MEINLKLLHKLYFLLGSLALLFLTKLIGVNILGGLLLIGFILYFAFSPRLAKLHKRQTFLILVLVFLLFILISKIIIDYHLPANYIPVTGLVMLTVILYNDLELAFIVSVLGSAFAGLIAGGSLYLSLILLFTGIITGFLIRQLNRRVGILSAGLYLGIIQMLTFILSYHSSFAQVNLRQCLPNLFNGVFCGIFVLALLPLLENVFGVVTNFSLLELSDFNHPLLKKMILEAPGTYHHSLIVGNLAEAAAEATGTNSLLTRIGAYYHDIGKLVKSEYFMENQKYDLSKHSGLTPSMSKMVIINHIKEGVELAKKYRLKPVIIDFITQHHGTSLVYYFYRKALEEVEEDQVQEEGFRYPGPKPATKETAIVLLADSVEAASRVVSNDPQPAKIEELVHKIINNKFIDGQLDDCDLTLRDLEKIAKIFIHILGGIYHGRIKYPESSKKDNIHKKHDHQAPADNHERDKRNPSEDS